VKRIAFIISSIILFTCSVNLYPQTEKLDDIKELFRLSGRYTQNVDIIKKQHQHINTYRLHEYNIPIFDMNRYFWAGVEYNKLDKRIFAMYDSAYTHEEIKQLINFYKTPLGEKLKLYGTRLNTDITHETGIYLEEMVDGLMYKFNAKSERASVFYDSVSYYIANLEPGHANRAIDSAIMLFPFEAEFYRYRAAIHLFLQDYEGVVKDLTTVLGFKYEDDYETYLLRATAHYELGHYRKFINDMFNILKVDALINNLDHVGEGNPEVFLQNLDIKISTAIASDPDYGLTYYVRAAFEIINTLIQDKVYDLDYSKVIGDLDKAISLDPKLSDAYALRLQCFSQLGKYDEMLKDCERLIELNPNVWEVYSYRGRARIYLGQYAEAIVDLKGISNVSDEFEDHYLIFDPAIPDLTDNIIIRGRSSLKTGNLEEAKEHQMNLASWGGQDFHAYLLEGDLARQEGSLDKAIEMYYNAILSSNLHASYFNDAFQYYARFYGDLGETLTTELLAQINQQINDLPDKDKVYFIRAHIKYYLNDLDGAEDDLDQLIIEKPNLREALYLRAWIRIKQENYDDALEDFNRLVDLEPYDKQGIYHSIARLKAKVGDLQGVVDYCEKAMGKGYYNTKDLIDLYIETLESLGDLNKAIEMYNDIYEYSDNMAVQYHLGTLLLKAGNAEGALTAFAETWNPDILTLSALSDLPYYQYYRLFDFRSDLEKIIESLPDAKDAYLIKGLLALELDDLDGAADDFTKMIKVFPSSPEGYLGRALVWTKEGNYKKAMKDYDQALNLDPQYTLGYYARGETKSLMGDRTGACRDWEEFRLRFLINEYPHYFLNYYCY